MYILYFNPSIPNHKMVHRSKAQSENGPPPMENTPPPTSRLLGTVFQLGFRGCQNDENQDISYGLRDPGHC